MLCIRTHPSYQKAQRSNTEAMAAEMPAIHALQQAQPEHFLLSLFFLHSFSSFLFSLGIDKCTMLCNEWDEDTQ